MILSALSANPGRWINGPEDIAADMEWHPCVYLRVTEEQPVYFIAVNIRRGLKDFALFKILNLINLYLQIVFTPCLGRKTCLQTQMR